VNDAGAVVERYDYTPYGEVTIQNGAGTPLPASAVGNTYLFTGRELDAETGLLHFRARAYSPKLGRFVQRDLQFGDGMSLYEYVRSRPTVFGDPSGRELFADTKETAERLQEWFYSYRASSGRLYKPHIRTDVVAVGKRWLVALAEWEGFHDVAADYDELADDPFMVRASNALNKRDQHVEVYRDAGVWRTRSTGLSTYERGLVLARHSRKTITPPGFWSYYPREAAASVVGTVEGVTSTLNPVSDKGLVAGLNYLFGYEVKPELRQAYQNGRVIGVVAGTTGQVVLTAYGVQQLATQGPAALAQILNSGRGAGVAVVSTSHVVVTTTAATGGVAFVAYHIGGKLERAFSPDEGGGGAAGAGGGRGGGTRGGAGTGGLGPEDFRSFRLKDVQGYEISGWLGIEGNRATWYVETWQRLAAAGEGNVMTLRAMFAELKALARAEGLTELRILSSDVMFKPNILARLAGPQDSVRQVGAYGVEIILRLGGG
jgi:RHS repeat-associated protein